MKSLNVGDPIPELTFHSYDGRSLSTAGIRGRSALVLFFYPRDNSPVCTAEACSFRDSYQVFQDAGAEVVGISSDSSNSHQGFADRYQLPYYLVADTDGSLRKLFGVPNTLGIIPGRVTYVIDREGIVRLVFNSSLQGAQHAQEALKVIQSFPRDLSSS